VSAQVRRLEHEPGAALFDRFARTATLTKAGEAVGMVTTCTITGLFDALDTFHRAHPGRHRHPHRGRFR
jgi:DNA-binding transcriptional LysR family regulator